MDMTFGVVDDSDEDFAALERVVLRSSSEIRLERWEDAEDLLEDVRSGRSKWPDLFLIDLNLPKMDGVALVAELRAQLSTRPLPLFIVSGSLRARDIDRSYLAGASLYLTKPLKASHVRAAIDLFSATPQSRSD